MAQGLGLYVRVLPVYVVVPQIQACALCMCMCAPQVVKGVPCVCV